MILTDDQKQIFKGQICPYCKGKTELTTSAAVHEKDYGGYIWQCKPCKARVECHKGTKNALGSLANTNLRAHRALAHKNLDAIWKNKHLTRNQAYKMLSEKLGIPKEYTHIAMFDLDTCIKVMRIASEYLKDIAVNSVNQCLLYYDEPLIILAGYEGQFYISMLQNEDYQEKGITNLAVLLSPSELLNLFYRRKCLLETINERQDKRWFIQKNWFIKNDKQFEVLVDFVCHDDNLPDKGLYLSVFDEILNIIKSKW